MCVYLCVCVCICVCGCVCVCVFVKFIPFRTNSPFRNGIRIQSLSKRQAHTKHSIRIQYPCRNGIGMPFGCRQCIAGNASNYIYRNGNPVRNGIICVETAMPFQMGYCTRTPFEKDILCECRVCECVCVCSKWHSHTIHMYIYICIYICICICVWVYVDSQMNAHMYWMHICAWMHICTECTL